jgi:hypothetical protein
MSNKKQIIFGKGRPVLKRKRRGGDYYNYTKEEIENFDAIQKELKKKALERF